MSSSTNLSQHPPNISGIMRYERVANLEAALKIKERRQKEWWTKAALAVAIIGTAAAGVALMINGA